MAELFIALGTTATTAKTLATIAQVAAVAGTVAGGLQQAQAAEVQAKSAQNLANFNAAVQRREAEARRQRAAFAQKRQAKKGTEAESTLIVALGEAGGLGSPVAGDLAAELASELELENLLIGFEGEVAAGRAETQAELDILSGKVARRRGRATATAFRIKAGESLLTGFGSTFA